MAIVDFLDNPPVNCRSNLNNIQILENEINFVSYQCLHRGRVAGIRKNRAVNAVIEQKKGTFKSVVAPRTGAWIETHE